MKEHDPIPTLRVIDSHTGGEPTRTVVAGAPPLSGATVAQQLAHLRDAHDWLRRSIILEPRGSDVMVGALLLPATDPDNCCGVIFFNNVGYLNMCGHGAIGVVATLQHLGKIRPGEVRLETSVGLVTATLHADGKVSLRNVPSYRCAQKVPLDVPGCGRVHADIAWGGNWFLLIDDHGIDVSLKNVSELTDFAVKARAVAAQMGLRGDDGGEIDHVELFAAVADGSADSKNFVLCPGNAYDRSPCGTGTSAKLACLHADGKLPPGRIWRQMSIVGSIFEGSVAVEDGQIVPTITGQAFVNADVQILLDPHDPFRHGLA